MMDYFEAMLLACKENATEAQPEETYEDYVMGEILSGRQSQFENSFN